MKSTSETDSLRLSERKRLADLILEVGFRAACAQVGMKPDAMARLVGGLPVRNATRIVASAAIAALPPAKVTSSHAPDPTAATVRPAWLTEWTEKYLTGEQRAAFERTLAKNAPNWVKR